MHEFNQSLRYDKRMWAADITGSIAYAKALTKVGILTPDEEKQIVQGLQEVGQEWENGTVCHVFVPSEWAGLRTVQHIVRNQAG